ncbi:MAG: hypothetical protein EGQ46_03940 [Clostridiales bacterium]|nr:hypothetical protein [Clostridiales bacterium]
MYQKERKLNPVLLIVLAAAMLAVGIAVWFLLTHVWVAGTFYSRNADVLDLRFADVTTADYDKLRKKAPNSEILWRIPFQGKTYDQDTDVLYVTSLTDEDVATLDYFTRLKTVEAQECTDYPQLAALTARRPEVTVEYAVTIDGREYPQDTAVVSISGITEEEINLLTYLPELTAVTAVGCRTPEQMTQLRDFCQEKGLSFALRFGTKTYPDTVQELDVTGVTDGELELLQLLPELKTLHLKNPEADPETVAQLRSTYPKADISWEVEIAGVSFPDDTKEVDLSTVLESSAAQTAAGTAAGTQTAVGAQTTAKTQTTTGTATGTQSTKETQSTAPAVTLNLEDLEKKMSYLSDAKQVFLGKCGLDNEELAALRERVRDSYKLVWTVQLGKKLTARTDDTTFMPVREHVYYFLDEDAYNLRYCEDMLCVDVGHMGLTNIDFVKGMPHLQILILAHNGQLQDISPISSCKELIFLELDWSAVKDFTPLVGCTSLEDLNIGLTYPSVEPLMQMTWLKNLWMVDRGGAYQLSQALPDTKIVASADVTVGAGWRNLPNYYKMRDMLGMEYMRG